MPRGRLLILAIVAVAALPLLWSGGDASAEEDPLLITSQIAYDVKGGEQPVRVSWQVNIVNNDPATDPAGSGGHLSFYDKLTLPALRGAGPIVAHAAGGQPLNVERDESAPGVAIAARVHLDRRLFYHDTYDFTLTYELAAVRQASLLVTPSYVFLPLIAAGNQATVSVGTPTDVGWEMSLEPQACTANGLSLTCGGSSSSYLAALLEVSRPDATASLPFQVQLRETTLPISIKYFAGEDNTARHWQDLATAALPVIEATYGFKYPGPPAVNLSQGGRQSVLGYEGLTTCHTGAACEITVSPIADDYTLLHELAHLWSGIYAKRWLSEGFAQLIAEETAAHLPAGLVQGSPPVRTSSPVDLQLDDWGDVTSAIGVSENELALQEAGYDRSLRFLTALRVDPGLETLQRVNQALAGAGQAADSRRFIDLLEETSGRVSDDLFALWVFPDSYSAILEDRRQARDRLAALERSIADTGLNPDVLTAIRDDVLAWRFDDALAQLDKAETGLTTYDQLQSRLSDLRALAEGAGLQFPQTIDAALVRWDFEKAGELLDSAQEAAQAYTDASQRVHSGRNLWEQFGLLGSDPNGHLGEAAASFGNGDFQSAIDEARTAIHLVDDASQAALRRLLIVAGVLAVLALATGVAVWVSRMREREFAGR